MLRTKSQVILSNIFIVTLLSVATHVYVLSITNGLWLEWVWDVAYNFASALADAKEGALAKSFINFTGLIFGGFIGYVCIESYSNRPLWLSFFTITYLIPILLTMPEWQWTICEYHKPDCGNPYWETYAVAVSWVFGTPCGLFIGSSVANALFHKPIK